jgi:hypothetical protein
MQKIKAFSLVLLFALCQWGLLEHPYTHPLTLDEHCKVCYIANQPAVAPPLLVSTLPFLQFVFPLSKLAILVTLPFSFFFFSRAPPAI